MPLIEGKYASQIRLMLKVELNGLQGADNMQNDIPWSQESTSEICLTVLLRCTQHCQQTGPAARRVLAVGPTLLNCSPSSMLLLVGQEEILERLAQTEFESAVQFLSSMQMKTTA